MKDVINIEELTENKFKETYNISSNEQDQDDETIVDDTQYNMSDSIIHKMSNMLASNLNSTYYNNYTGTQTVTSGIYPSVTTGTTGQYYTSVLGSGGLGGATQSWYGNVPTTTNISTSLSVGGDVKISGELVVNGVSLSERLDKIEQRLAIIRPNTELEDRWDELKELGNRYRELEKELNEKEAIWDLLKR